MDDDDEEKPLPQSRAEDATAHPQSSSAASSSPQTEPAPADSAAPSATCSNTTDPLSNSDNDDNDDDDEKPSSTRTRKSTENATRPRNATAAASKKRKAGDADVAIERNAETSSARADGPPAEKVDVATQLGLRVGDRLQVYWTICDEASDDDERHADGEEKEGDGKAKMDGDGNGEAKKEVATMWWAASLVKNTGRMHVLTDEELEEGDTDAEPFPSRKDTRKRARTTDRDDSNPDENDPVQVPVYELNYDPMPDYGYPDHSVEEVCFVSDHVLLNLSTQEMMTFKREGAPSPPTSPRRDDLSVRFPHLDQRLLADGNEPGTERIVEEFSDEDHLRRYMNGIMEETFRRSGLDVKMKKLSAAKQRLVAERIGRTKEELLGKMMREVEGMERGKKVLTGDMVRKCVGEMKL